ncbi:unnamed protein product [marine sediment metagenome]|uniref:Uncharacterized protein n=1 Tax=marine sediment metagenome TaxID=412755 RepID=X1QN16_9ZZZZ
MAQEGAITQVIYRTTTTGLFYALPAAAVTVELNSIFQLGITWLNTSEEAFQGHIELVITKPDGTTVTLSDVMHQDLEVGPDESATVLFEAIILDQYGTYSAQATLTETDEAEVLDLETFSFATIAAPLAVAEFDISTLLASIMPLIMLIMVFMMLKPMLAGMAEATK